MKIGIDFGTTFSLPSCVVNGSSVTLLPRGESGVPSLFYYDREVDIQIGTVAEDNGTYYPENLIRDIKMSISSNKDKFVADGKTFSKKEVIGSILREVGRLAKEECLRREYTSQTLDGVVVSVPAAFNIREISFIRDAVEMPINKNGAGLKFLGFIREPVAAAIAYFNAPNAEDEKSILVYDLGGGTCDIAIVRSDKKSSEWYTVIDSEMQRVGGRDWDKVVVNLIKRKIKEKFGLSSFDKKAEEEMYRQAVSAKENLTKTNTARVQLMVAGRVLSCVISLAEFEQETSKLMNSTMNIVERLIEKNNAKIDYIVCVGGSSNMPQVKTAFEMKYPDIPIKVYEPEKAISFGAAIYAENLTEDRFLRDICKFSYGVRFIEDYFLHKDKDRRKIYNYIFKGAILPASAELTGQPVEDGYSGITFAIYESECEDAKYEPQNGTEIGSVSVTGLVNSKASDSFLVTIQIDKSGLMCVKAIEKKSGKTAAAEIQLTSF